MCQGRALGHAGWWGPRACRRVVGPAGELGSGILSPVASWLLKGWGWETKPFMVRWGNRPGEGTAQGSGKWKTGRKGSCFGTSSALRVVWGLDWGPWWVLVEPLNQSYKVKGLVTREAQTERGGEVRLPYTLAAQL